MAGSSGWEKLVASGNRLRNLSLDDVRRHLTEGLELRVDPAQIRRGEGLEADVLIASPARLGELQVGVVCTEHYDQSVQSNKSSYRSTFTAIEHEDWKPLQSVPGRQRVSLSIPPGAPFSYEAAACPSGGRSSCGGAADVPWTSERASRSACGREPDLRASTR